MPQTVFPAPGPVSNTNVQWTGAANAFCAISHTRSLVAKVRARNIVRGSHENVNRRKSGKINARSVVRGSHENNTRRKPGLIQKFKLPITKTQVFSQNTTVNKLFSSRVLRSPLPKAKENILLKVNKITGGIPLKNALVDSKLDVNNIEKLTVPKASTQVFSLSIVVEQLKKDYTSLKNPFPKTLDAIALNTGKLIDVAAVRGTWSENLDSVIFDTTLLEKPISVLRQSLPKVAEKEALDVNNIEKLKVPKEYAQVFSLRTRQEKILSLAPGRQNVFSAADPAFKRREPIQFWN
jgi:hypothetical protein